MRAAIKRGSLTPGGGSLTRAGDKIRSARAADAEWAATTRTEMVPLTGRTAPKGPTATASAGDLPRVGDLADARLRTERARASTAELELGKLRGELVPLDEVRAEVAQRYTTVRTRLLGVPARCRQRAPHLAAADVRLIDDFIREALEELAAQEDGHG